MAVTFYRIRILAAIPVRLPGPYLPAGSGEPEGAFPVALYRHQTLNQNPESHVRENLATHCFIGVTAPSLRGFSQPPTPFALWSRPAIDTLIRERFGIDMQGRLVGKYLKRWGFAPQRPVKRALEQRPEEVSRWLDATYPTIKGRRSGRGRHLLG